jgi:hypothetical protein
MAHFFEVYNISLIPGQTGYCTSAIKHSRWKQPISSPILATKSRRKNPKLEGRLGWRLGWRLGGWGSPEGWEEAGRMEGASWAQILVSVLPKEEDSYSMHKSHPISLFNTDYKMVMRVWANRLGPILATTKGFHPRMRWQGEHHQRPDDH